MSYLQELKRQENERIIGTKGRIYPNEPPEDTKTRDIGYGHKLSKDEESSLSVYGIDISDGITEEEASNILAIDHITHRTRARRVMGDEVWQNLPEEGKNLLADYSFTGVLEKFPSFRSAMENRDKAGVLKEYERKYTKEGELVPMDRRNAMALSLIDSMEGYWQ